MAAKKDPIVFDRRPWGLATQPRPVAPPAAPPRPPETAIRRPFEGAAYQNRPFGPFPPSPSDLAGGDHSPVWRFTDPVAQLRYGGEWRVISRHDIREDFSWGRIAILIATVSGASAQRIDLQPMVEVRVYQLMGGVAELVMEQAAAQRQDQTPATSPGPLSFCWRAGELPDAYEVRARARRGGEADAPGEFPNDVESLQVSVSGRFHR